MPSDLSFDAAPQLSRVEEFFLARQPILDRNQALIAYELLFRRAGGKAADVTNDLSATASVIAHASELGMENVIGNSLGFLNVDTVVLMSDFIKFLPNKKVMLELLETIEVTPAVVARVAELSKAGYKFALDDVVEDSPGLQQLLPYVSVIKIDIFDMPRDTLSALYKRLKTAGKPMLAEKVETREDFEFCLSLGFDYFQGYYFARPVIMAGKKLAPSQVALIEIMAQIDSDADNVDLERSIKRDAALGLTLLRLVNTPAMGMVRRIESLGQALTILGRRQLYRWLQIMLYTEPDKSRHTISPLLLLASSRGKLLELMTLKHNPRRSDLADKAFTVGIMSLMDTLFSLPMENILEKMSVADEVRVALLGREGLYGDMLKLSEYLERGQDYDALAAPILEKLALSSEELYELQVAAFEWSDSIAYTN
ncbi:MAG: EAL domain-containing protein [Burkholderiaceae bacterium]|nr:EAL domain-containing protein [Burkholderiaceae bacterium]